MFLVLQTDEIATDKDADADADVDLNPDENYPAPYLQPLFFVPPVPFIPLNGKIDWNVEKKTISTRTNYDSFADGLLPGSKPWYINNNFAGLGHFGRGRRRKRFGRKWNYNSPYNNEVS